jgi:hypothetical protein
VPAGAGCAEGLAAGAVSYIFYEYFSENAYPAKIYCIITLFCQNLFLVISADAVIM